MRLLARWLLLGMLLTCILSSLRPVVGPCQAGESKRPNIIFLLTDDQRWDTLGCMGNSIIKTPNVDRLAAQGVVFDQCFVTTAICMTNRACIFTGQYAARHGIWDFKTSFPPKQLAQTYPALLKRAGYYVGFIGKWGVGKPPEDLLDYNRGWPGQNRYYEKRKGEDPFTYLTPGPDQDGLVARQRDRVHLTTKMGDQALEFLDSAPADRPFCLAFSFKSPHCQDGQPAFRQFPYDAHLHGLYQDVTIPPATLSDPAFFDALPEFLRTSENRRRWELRFATPEMYQHSVKSYYRLVSGVDRVVGRIVARLKQKGLTDNTIILYTGDHGFYLGERGFAGKWYPHEVSIRVPLVVYDPRLPAAERGTRRDQTVLTIDLAPTMLAMAGVAVPNTMQGRSLTPLLEGETPEWRTEFFYEHLFKHRTIPCSEAVRDSRYKYIRYVESDPLCEELYDLEKDPDEAHNLANDPAHAATLERMREKWTAWHERAK